VAEIPQLIWPDRPRTSGADDQLATLEAAGKLAAATVMLGPVELALPAVAQYQPQPPLTISLDRARIG
jgi:hypothetical protein